MLAAKSLIVLVPIFGSGIPWRHNLPVAIYEKLAAQPYRISGPKANAKKSEVTICPPPFIEMLKLVGIVLNQMCKGRICRIVGVEFRLLIFDSFLG
jgi:hypothetical protein